MVGIVCSIIAGIFISLQGVFKTRLSDKIGLWETTLTVHGVGFVFALILVIILGGGNLKKIGEVNKFYLLGGMFGVLIVYGVMKGISLLGASVSTSILIIAQLVFATVIDTFGLFGSEKIKFDFTKPLGILVMIVGILIFKLK